MTIPSFTADASLYRGRGSHGASRQWSAAETVAILTPQGFGCPGNEYACDEHCRSLGRRGGYCGGFLWHTCYCIDSWSVVPRPAPELPNVRIPRPTIG